MTSEELKSFCKEFEISKNLLMLFSKDRLNEYKSNQSHINNFLLMQILAPKLGILEIVTRNKIALILSLNDSKFISKQTFGYWAKVINDKKIHNFIVDLAKIDFRKYSKFNKKYEFRNYQKVKVVYSLLVTIRNRAFHFENLLKTKGAKPRITTILNDIVIGVDPDKLESFCDDVLECFESGLSRYLKNGAQGAPLISK
ncbi:hypothetical protein [Campylobacter corcagiensis]|uniref:ATPase n=1 Tax=Campylobacter corcagiensis TaxID=1448857 RepID=A0A7M1LIH9_9BACT|nr:hypothetical protein [Campylobacter corcagiensis]QKF64518.1 hypothetical protein CCORG_0652 [Campylobacter corcagiensis]QOQ87305.1 ATPase [Campylobacter corcagiensis]